MTLYTVTSGGAVNALDINQYDQLLTGTMTDQQVTVANRIAAQLTGATAASGYVGGTTSGAPTSGTFAVGDMVIDQTGPLWVCTTAGTPGTWMSHWVRINTTILGATTASVTWSSIPSGYNALKIAYHARGTNASVAVTNAIQFNADTGAHYYWQLLEGNTTTVVGADLMAQTNGSVGYTPGASATAKLFSSGTCVITGVQQTADNVTWMAMNCGPTALTTGNVKIGLYGGVWAPTATAAVTSITLFPSAGSWAADSTFTLYGSP